MSTPTKPSFYNSTAGEIDTMVGGTNVTDLSVGGTAADLSATGGANHIVKQTSSGGALTVATLVAGDIPSSLNATALATGSTAATQSPLDDSTNIATTAYTDAAVTAGIAAAGTPNVVSLTNADAGSLIVGQVVYASALGSVDKAKADSATTCEVIGISQTAVATTAAAAVQISDVFTFSSTAQVDAVFGTTGGFPTAGQKYFLSAATAGLGTATAPSSTGNKSKLLGYSISATKFKIAIGPTYTA